MSKVAKYLQGHILGEVTTRLDVREKESTDGSLLNELPEIVAYPKSNNDVRKICRFAWQLGEKGHALNIHPAGMGLSSTGSSLGKGLKLSLARHMNNLYELDVKQRLLRVQPGASIDTVQGALRLQGLAIPAVISGRGTIGGAVADDMGSILSGKYGYMRDWVSQLEVVLDSGDVIQTERISKGELNKRKGIQGRVGDVYRGIDRILEEHDGFLKQINAQATYDRSGYPGIFDVKQKNGSFDLTPLFVGSQGTLGVISEMILKAEFMPKETSIAVVAFPSTEEAHDLLDELRAMNPAILEYYSGTYLAESIKQGKSYDWLKTDENIETVIVFGFDDFSERNRSRKLRKALKVIDKAKQFSITNLKDEDVSVVGNFLEITNYLSLPTDRDDSIGAELIPAFYVPRTSFEEFTKGLKSISSSLHVDLALQGSALTDIYSIRSILSMKKVSDKQKIFKIIANVNDLLVQLKGDLIAAGGEGRLLSRFARSNWDEEYEQIVAEIKQVLDPHGIFNPGVKSPVELKDLVKQLRSDNSIGLS